MSHPHVIIIGAGLGGLCLAQGLRRRGIGFEIFERDDSLTTRLQGYRIHVDGQGDAALAASLPEHLYRLFRATSGTPRQLDMTVYDHLLNRLTVNESDDPDGIHMSVNRVTLREILGSGIDVRFGRRLTHYERHAGGRVTAHFQDGGTATGDVLVAADGVNSAVRRQYLPHARIVETGIRQLCGRIPLNAETRPLFTDEMFAVFTPIVGPGGEYVGLGPVEFPEPIERAAARLAPEVRLSGARDYMTVSFGGRLPDISDKAEVLERISDWHPNIRGMIEHWESETVFPITLRTSVPIDPWPATNVTLLGDAIHAMSPAGGVGANTAMRDAATLAAALAQGPEAIAGYEAAMTEYGFAAVRDSAANGERVLGSDPLPI
ncbi:FAD-dependent oxidoreductase [Nonomuraea sp. NPDC050536]|uniref:FAD-dependent oxidoreductase n=1 Tax=Nonomuraea sp. NPDC050536 TaxID=3364366 RepID=UPI0037C50196